MPKTKTDSRPDDYTVRIRRVETWLGRAEEERKSGDLDVAFILYWIAFNAAYARDFAADDPPTLDAIENYIRDLLRADQSHTIRDTIWNDSRGHIQTVVDIEYLFNRYWRHANDRPWGDDWKSKFSKDRKFVRDALRTNKYEATDKILEIVSGRLCTLRNQLVHGGARWKSRYNRDSVIDGTHILGSLVPVFLEVMRANPRKNWGQPYYRPGLKGQSTPSMDRRRRYGDDGDDS